MTNEHGPITPDEALARAIKIVTTRNPGIYGGSGAGGGHFELDELLCEVLRSLGYDKLIDYYENKDRWFE